MQQNSKIIKLSFIVLIYFAHSLSLNAQTRTDAAPSFGRAFEAELPSNPDNGDSSGSTDLVPPSDFVPPKKGEPANDPSADPSNNSTSTNSGVNQDDPNFESGGLPGEDTDLDKLDRPTGFGDKPSSTGNSQNSGNGGVTNTASKGNNSQNPSAQPGGNGSNTGLSNGNKNPGANQGNSAGNYSIENLTGLIMGSLNNGGLSAEEINDFSENESYTKETVQHAVGFNKLARELTNEQLKELKVPELKHEEPSAEAKKLAQKVIDEVMNRPISERYNTVVNKSAWPRSSPELINLNYTKVLDGPCHIVFKDYFSSDKDKQYKWFSSPLYSTAHQLMDLPRVKLEQMRLASCSGTSCSLDDGSGSQGFFKSSIKDSLRLGSLSGSGSSSGLLACIKNEKSLGERTIENIKLNFKKNNNKVDISFMQELFPQLDAQSDGKPKLCIDFVGSRFPWSAYNNKFFNSYLTIGALQQKQDAFEYFQALAAKGGGILGGSSDKLKIGHTIADNDRFFPQMGNYALKVEEITGSTCPKIDEMAHETTNEGIKAGTNGSPLIVRRIGQDPLTYDETNRLDMPTSNYQGFTRYMVFKCGGGQEFRGNTLGGHLGALFGLAKDKSQTMCQTSDNAKPYDGKVKAYWDWELNYGESIIPYGETRVC